jgi:hypothetical protein
MWSNWKVLICAVILTLLLSTMTLAQDPGPIIQDGTPVVMDQKPAPRTADGKPDLSGVWAVPSTDEQRILATRYGALNNQPPSLTAWAAERFAYNQDNRQTVALEGSGYGSGSVGGRQELNPFFKCLPPTTGYLLNGWGSISPLEIIQSPKRVLMIMEYDSTVRQIWTDGRKHPDPVEVTWTGDSVGTWEGDTLVVDTVGMHSEYWLNNRGHVVSPGLRIIERYKRLDLYTMQVDYTFEDAKAFKTPWTMRAFKRLRPTWELTEDPRCYPGSLDQRVNQENFEGLWVEH